MKTTLMLASNFICMCVISMARILPEELHNHNNTGITPQTILKRKYVPAKPEAIFQYFFIFYGDITCNQRQLWVRYWTLHFV